MTLRGVESVRRLEGNRGRCWPGSDTRSGGVYWRVGSAVGRFRCLIQDNFHVALPFRRKRRGSESPASAMFALGQRNRFKILCCAEFACARAEMPDWFRMVNCESLATCCGMFAALI